MTGSKGLDDNLASELPIDDKASAAEAIVIREVLELLRGRVRWLPRGRNSTDVLTKFQGAHALPLWQLLKTGRFLLSPEDEVRRNEWRRGRGYRPRRRVGIRVASRHDSHG